MKQLYRNRAVGNTAVFTALRERFCISLSKQEMAMLCIISRGVPARKELLVQGRELLVTRFISADLSDTVNLLSMAEMFNEEDDADFWLPFADTAAKCHAILQGRIPATDSCCTSVHRLADRRLRQAPSTPD